MSTHGCAVRRQRLAADNGGHGRWPAWLLRSIKGDHRKGIGCLKMKKRDRLLCFELDFLYLGLQLNICKTN